MTVDNRGKTWTKDDYKLLSDAFGEDESLMGICRKLGRTPGAVVAKLEQLGLLTNVGRNYHRVDPDPWASWQSVVILDEEFKKGLK